RQARPSEREQLFLADRFVEDDGGADLLAPGRVWDAEAHGLLHRRMGFEHLVDLPWRDLFAAAVDELFDPAQKAQVAIGIQHAKVSRPEPAVRERACVRLRIVLVAVDDIWAAH